MDRITNPELQTDPREFIEGDEHTPATPLDPNWLTTLQEELIAVVLASGQTPSSAERDQLLKAIQSMGGKGIQVDTFTASGTWTKPDKAKWIEVIAIGQGAGGASGEATADTAVARGGPGGGGGAMQYLSLSADMVDSSCAVSVPNLGGKGAAASTGASNPGGYGSPSSIRLTPTCFLLAEGAPNTTSNTFPQGGAGGGYRGTQGLLAGGKGGNGGAYQGGAGTNTVDGAPASRGGGAGGGGAGGGLAIGASTGQMGGYGGSSLMGGATGSGGQPNADAPVAAIALGYVGAGGAGGGSSATGPGGSGADGVSYGGGGGGGGAARAGEYSGAGGNGGPGIVVVITHF